MFNYPQPQTVEKKPELSGMRGGLGLWSITGCATSHREWNSVTEHTQDNAAILSLKTTGSPDLLDFEAE